jgi:hypothetical protein
LSGAFASFKKSKAAANRHTKQHNPTVARRNLIPEGLVHSKAQQAESTGPMRDEMDRLFLKGFLCETSFYPESQDVRDLVYPLPPIVAGGLHSVLLLQSIDHRRIQLGNEVCGPQRIVVVDQAIKPTFR